MGKIKSNTEKIRIMYHRLQARIYSEGLLVLNSDDAWKHFAQRFKFDDFGREDDEDDMFEEEHFGGGESLPEGSDTILKKGRYIPD